VSDSLLKAVPVNDRNARVLKKDMLKIRNDVFLSPLNPDPKPEGLFRTKDPTSSKSSGSPNRKIGRAVSYLDKR
jgi:hypothetical protein